MNDGTTWDVAVVGGGLAGLTAAAYLARAGQKVIVLEQSAHLGGRASTTDKGGFQFNQGPHALYRAAEGMKILAELGVSLPGGVPEGPDRVMSYRGRTFQVPVSPEEVQRIDALTPDARNEIAAFFAELPTLDTTPLQRVVWESWLADNFLTEDARLFIAAIARLANYANAPHLQSAGATLDQLRIGFGGVVYLDGGWQSLVGALKTKATENGAEVLTSTSVTSAEPTEDGWHLHTHNGATVQAKSVVFTGPPTSAMALLKNFPDAVECLSGLVPVRAACLDLGLSRLPAPTRFGLGMDRPLYFSLHSAWAQLAPDNGALIQVAKYLDDRAPQEASALQHELETWLDELQPGWRDVVVQRRFLPKMIVTHATVTAEMRGLPGRPGPELPGVPGFYVAGDWVGTHGMLADASFASGREAAQRIVAQNQSTALAFAP